LNFFKAQLLSSTIWCHRYSELIEQYINKYLTENGVADSVIKYVDNSDASKYLSLKLPFENPINEMNSIPFFAKRKSNSFFGSLEYMHKAIHLLKTNWDSKADYFVLRDKKAIKLTSYLSSEGNYEVSCQRPDIIQERILTSIKDVQSVNDSYNEMINFLKLIEREEELLVSLQFSSYT
jgi:hypothetical protein